MPEKDRSVKGMFNPFPGLRPFTPEESDLFFGREGHSEAVLKKLKQNRFATVIGASGSGKSSLVFCGVIPRLIDLEGKKISRWRVLTMRPGNDPLGNLIAMLAEGIPVEKQKTIDRTIIESLIRKDEKGLVNAVNKLKIIKDSKTLIIIDQFEELFRYKAAVKPGIRKGNSRYFMDLLVNAVEDMSSGISVITTLRSDYIGDCAQYRGLTELINNSNYLIPHMSEADYREVIAGPVKYAGGTIETELVDLLISEIGERTDQLPVLQHALMRTWNNWHSMEMSDKPISIANYNAIGKMSGAMSRHANEAFEELNSREQEICENLFRTITEKGPDNKGVRRPTRLSTIAAIARCSEKELIKVINSFRSSGRSFIKPAEDVDLKSDTVIDISHESLMRIWDRLSEWVDKEAESKQMYLKLSEAAAMFQEGKTTLWRPPDLQLALKWRKENRPTLTWAERYNPAFERAMVYLRTSEKEYITQEENKLLAQKKRLRRSRITALVGSVAAVIAVFLMLFAFVKRGEALRGFRVAEEQRKQATEQKIMAQSSAKIAERNAKEAKEKEALALENASEATLTALDALRQKEIANINAREAREREALALANAESAEINAVNTMRHRMVSIGKAMAIKSLQFRGEGDIQVLLAYQAYLFNKRNGGIKNDADIYQGLYNVEKVYEGLNYRTYDGHKEKVYSLAFLPGTKQFCSSGADGSVLRWNIQDSQPEPSPVYEGDDIIEVLTVSDDGRLMACGSSNAVIKIIPTSWQGTIYELTGHTNKIKSLAFTPDSKRLISAGVDGQIILWNIETREPSVLISAEEAINSLDISRSGKYLVAASDNGIIHLWDMNNNSATNTIDTGNGSAEVVRFRDNASYAVGYNNGILELRGVEEETIIESIMAHTLKITDIRFNVELNQMATSSEDGFVKIWNYDDFTEPPVSLEDNDGIVYALAFSPEGQILLSGSEGSEGGSNIIARSPHIDYMAQNMCSLASRNFTDEEWGIYVGRDIEYQETCNPDKLRIQAREIRGD